MPASRWPLTAGSPIQAVVVATVYRGRLLAPLNPGPDARAGGGALATSATFAGAGKKADSGGATITAVGTLAGTGRKSDSGGVTFAAVGTLAGNGRKADSGGASITVMAALTGSGRQSTAAGGTVAGSVSLAGAGRKATPGGATLAAYVTPSGSGARSASGAGSIIASIALSGNGQKTIASGGSVVATATLSGGGAVAPLDLAVGLIGEGVAQVSAGVAAGGGGWGSARVIGWGRGGEVRSFGSSRQPPYPIARSGSGRLALHVRMSGAGVAWNDDDEAMTVLLMAA